MPYKDARKQRAYQREYQRKQRSKGLVTSEKPTLDFGLKSANDLIIVLEYIINEILPSDLDLGVKGRVIAQLLSVGCKLVETVEIEERLAKLEKAMLGPRLKPLNL
jgi:hypothetical protein